MATKHAVFSFFIGFLAKKKDEYENFAKNLKLNFERNVNKSQFVTVVLGDFNA